jgi:L-asparaginase II
MSASFSPSSTPLRVVVSRESDESEHLVDVVAFSSDGLVAAFGNQNRGVIPRSAIKPIQVVPLVRSGAAAAFDVSDREIALGSASHSAEAAHIDAVEQWLHRIGLDESALECGAGRPFSVDEADRRLRAGETFTPICNTCSGKHTAFLTIARHLDVEPSGYIERDHPVQQVVIAAVEEFTGVSLSEAPSGVDGCGIPTFELPLTALARSMMSLVEPGRFDADTAAAAARVTIALSQNPFWVSGTGRAEAVLTAAAAEPLVIKTGAEGVFTAALPERGFGIALKARDGATRASELAIAAVLEHLGAVPAGHAVRDVTNAAGTVVGAMRVQMP